MSRIIADYIRPIGEFSSQMEVEKMVVNIPYRSSESFAAERISVRLSSMRRTVGAILLAFVAALLLGALLSRLPEALGGMDMQNLIPFDDPIALSTFTA